MGMVYADIELINGQDAKAKDGDLSDAEVRRMPVRALVDSSAATFVVNERIRLSLVGCTNK